MVSKYNDFNRTIWACMREKKHRYMFREGEELKPGEHWVRGFRDNVIISPEAPQLI